jgi:hypothetical protein
MDGLLLQDWVTLRGLNTAGTPIPVITQGSDGWLDIGDYEDLVFTLDVREITNPSSPNVMLVYETSPTVQDTSFRAMVNAFTPVAGQRIDRVLATYAGVPAARYVRWKLTSTVQSASTYDITFRVLVAAYAWVKR